jgi:hypothetical protein
MKKSYGLEYNKTKECEIFIFGDDLKFWSFFKMKHWVCKESTQFFLIHIYSIMINKNNVVHWGTFKYFLEKVTKIFIQKFICM